MGGAVRPRVTITAHARQRCRRRNIDPEVLPTVVEHSDRYQPCPGGRPGLTITPRRLDAFAADDPRRKAIERAVGVTVIVLPPSRRHHPVCVVTARKSGTA